MESKEPVYFIYQSKLDALEEMLDSFTRKYSLYSKYAEGKLEGLLMDYYYLPNYNMAAEKERQKVVRKLNTILRKGLKDARRNEKWLESIERNNNI